MVELDEARIKHRLDLFLKFYLLAMGIPIWFNCDGFGVGERSMWLEMGRTGGSWDDSLNNL